MTPDDDSPGERLAGRLKVALIVATVVLVGVAGAVLLMRQVNFVRQAAMRMKGSGDLCQFALAEHNFSDHTQSGLVGPFAINSDGLTRPELSFRVSLLPYIEMHKVHELIDLNESWDSARNAPATSRVIRNLQSPDTPDATKPDTPYRVFYGGGALFAADGTPVKFKEVPDGLSSTILFVHATEAVPWAKPQEFPYTATTPLPPLGSPGLGKDGFNVAMADGSVRLLRHTIAEADLRSLIEKADGRGADID